jgi:hypothetical protein
MGASGRVAVSVHCSSDTKASEGGCSSGRAVLDVEVL